MREISKEKEDFVQNSLFELSYLFVNMARLALLVVAAAAFMAVACATTFTVLPHHDWIMEKAILPSDQGMSGISNSSFSNHSVSRLQYINVLTPYSCVPFHCSPSS